MTSGRKPAGAPDDWDEKQAAGVPEDDAPENEGSAKDEERVANDLDALLADVTRERDEYLDLAQRAKADFENYRKRAARDAQEAERRGKAALARQLLPAIDNLERALKSAGVESPLADRTPAEEAPSEEVSSTEALARGVALVLGELQATLAGAGVEAYDPVGEAFDPSWHEALATRAAEGTEGGKVIETLERGYRLDGQVLRPARVVVSE
jgi:molecular chaperone GrpE